MHRILREFLLIISTENSNMVAPLSRSNSITGPAIVAPLDQLSQSHTDLVQSDQSNGMVVAKEPSQVPLNVPIEIWTTILARCLPKDMSNFSLASRFCHAMYHETLRTLFRPHTGTTEDIVKFLASDAFKSAFAGQKVFLPDDLAFKNFQALFTKNTRLDKTCHGDLLQTGRLLLNFDYLYSGRKLKSLMDIGICTFRNPDSFPDSTAPADIDLSMVLHRKQWDFIIDRMPWMLAKQQKLYIQPFMRIPLDALDAGIYKLANIYKADWLKVFLEAGIRVKNSNSKKYEKLLLKLAGESKHIEVFQLLIKLGVNKNNAFLTALKEDALKEDGSFSITKLFLNHEANPNITDEDGNTPLQIAFSKRYPLAVMQLLVQKGANRNVQDIAGKTLLQQLVAMSSVEIGLAWKNHCASIATAWEISYSAAEIPAEEFRIAVMECLLEGGENKADPNIKDEDGNTPLLIALKQNRPVPIIEFLLNHEANPTITDEDGNAPLQIAFRKRYPLAVMQLLVQKGANRNVQDIAGKTLLHHLVAMSSVDIGLAWKNHCASIATAWEISYSAAEIPAEEFRIAVMECLLEGGENKADPNIKDEDGNTPLLIALKQNRPVSIIEFLLNHEANPTITDEDGNAPLQIAFSKRYPLAVMQLLVQKGANRNVQDIAGKTLLHHLVAMSSVDIGLAWKNHCASIATALEISYSAAEIPAEEFRIAVMECLLEGGENKADPNIKDEDGNTPLLIALKQNRPVPIIEFLLNHEADPNITDEVGNAPLLIALKQNRPVPIIEFLLNHEADPNITDEVGNAPLLIALKQNRPVPIIEFLLNHEADPTITDEDGNAPLQIAFSKRYPLAVMQLLVQKGANRNVQDIAGKTLLQQLVAMSSFEIGLAWKNHCASIATAWEISYSAAEIPAEEFRIAFMECLLEGGENKADPNIKDEDGNTPLLIALKQNRPVPIIEFLLNHEADPTITDENGNAPLLIALKQNRPVSIIEFLLNHEADPTITDEDGNAPLQIAFSKRYPLAVMQLLVQKGANRNVQDIAGKTLLQQLVAMSSFEIGLAWKNHCASIATAWEISYSAAEIPAEEFRIAFMECLLEGGENKADPNIKDEDGNTPLLIALKKNRPVPIIEFLLNHEADPTIMDEDGNAPLQIAFNERHPFAVMQLLLQKGANPNMLDIERLTPLQHLVVMSSFEIGLAWKNHCASIATAWEISYSAAEIPAEEFRIALIKCFLQHEADPRDIKDKQGRTVWHILLEGLQPPINADIDSDLFDKFKQYFGSGNFNPLRSKEDRITLQLAKKAGHNEMVTFLRDEMQNNLKGEIEAKYSPRFAWLGSLFNRFQIWWFGL